MAGITVSGVGSGLDVNTIVSDLIKAERSPVEKRLDTREATLQAKLSAIGTFKGAVSDFQSALSGVNSSSGFQSMTTSVGDTTLFTANATSVAQTGDYSIGVTQLAQAHKLVTAAGLFTNTTDTVGTGTLTFEFGSYDNADNTGDNPTGTGTFTANAAKTAKTVTLDSSNNTLSGVRDAINKANIGVRAGIVYDGSGYRLTLTSTDSGAKNSLRISVTGDGDSDNTDAAGLSVLAYDPTNSTPVANMTRTVKAQDAAVTVDGVNITSASNSVVGAVPGVTLTLKKAGASSTLSVAQDTSATTKAVGDFVTAYNKLATTAKSLTAYDATDTTQNGVLLGDITVTAIMRQINSVFTSAVTGATGAPRSLADVGVSLQKDGTLKLDGSKLQAALAQSPQAVAALFTRTGTTTDSLVSFNSAKTSNTAATGTYNVFVSRLATQGQYIGGTTGGGGAFTIDNTNHSFGITVNGTSATITLTDGSYTGAALAAQLQSQINADSTLAKAGASVSVGYDSGSDAFTFTSNTYGSTSKVAFTTANADLGIIIGSGTTGINAAGAIGSGSQVATQGYYTGNALGAGVGSFTITGGSDTFAIKINDVQSGTITLSDNGGSPYTGAALAAHLQSRINADGSLINASALVSINYDAGSGQFVVTSNAYGSASKVEFTQINAALSTNLGISVGSGTAGQAGVAAATGSGRTLVGTGDAAGIAVDILGGAATTTGSSRGTVSLSNGIAQRLDTLISDFLDSSGALGSRVEGLNRQVKQISDQRTALDTRMTALEARYRAQFTAMDKLVSQLTATSNYLTQMFSSNNKDK